MLDRVVENVIALGVPGLVLVVAVGSSGLAGAAALTASLAALGGPLGMLGGIAVLGIMTLVSREVAKYGLSTVVRRVVIGLRETHSDDEIREVVRGYPISRSLKREVLEAIDQASANESK